MAKDVITRFKLETTQYDSALRDASKKLTDLTKEINKAGASFDSFSKEQVDAARELGKTASGATNLKDKLRDLVGAYNQTARAYNALTKEQQQSDFGKAMAESLGTLQSRITQTKNELYVMNDATKNTGSIMDKLAGKLTVNIDALKLFDIGLKAASGALNVVKDAFFANEENLDEWGRTVKSCESLYNGFLVSLNSGNIGGFLSNIDDIVNAARAAYDALDELGTYNAFNQINNIKGQADFQEAINAYRGNPSMANRQRLLASYAVYKGNMNPRRDLERQAYEAEVARVAAEHKVDAKDLLDALSGDWGSYKKLKALPLTGVGFNVLGGGMFGSWQNTQVAVPANREERLGQVLRQINDVGELDYLQKLGATAYQTTLEMANIDKQMQRALRAGGGSSGSTGRSGGGGGGRSAASVPATSMWSGTLADYALQIRGLQTQQQDVTNRTEYARLQRHIDYIQQQIDFIKGKPGATLGESLGGSTDYWAGVKEKLNAPLDVKLIEGPVRELTSGANTVKVSWQDAAAAIQSVGQAFSMIENPAAKVVGIIGQAIATIALGFAQATTQAAAGGPFAWIAAIAGGLGTMISTIAAIKQATAGSYAEGGIIPGNNHNDGLIANVSSGELILNAAQQRNVVNALYGQRAGGNSQPYVNAETIVIGLNNYFKRIGRGEIVTTR